MLLEQNHVYLIYEENSYLSHSNLQVQEARQNHDDDAVKKAVNEYDEALER